MAGPPPDTVPRRFLATVAAHGDVVALFDPFDDTRTLTYRDYAEGVATVARGLAQLGLGTGDRLMIMMRNRPEFHLADTAALCLGGTPFSVYNTASEEEIAYAAGHTHAKVAIVEDAAFLGRLEAARERIPGLEVVVLDGRYPDAHEWSELLSYGQADVAQLARHGASDDVATVIFTSGTTGPAKAVAITHRNVCSAADAVLTRTELGDVAGKRAVSYLPMAHIAERLTSHYLPMLYGLSVAPCPDMLRFHEYALAVRPHVVFGVPRVWEKLQQGVLAAAGADPERAKALDDGVAAGRELVVAARQGPLTKEQQDTWDFLDAVAFSTVRELTGLSEVLLAVSGAAPISPDLVEWFRAIRVPLAEVYGMSETTGVISWEPNQPKAGTVGTALPGVEIHIADDGEILVRGDNVFPGYLDNPAATAEALEDGWLHTGDIGSLDAEGYLSIVDRKKELIITAGGENVSPANLEAALSTLPLVGQACVVGDRQRFPAAIVTLDADYAPIWAAQHAKVGADLARLAKDPDVIAEVGRGIEEVNNRFTRAYQVKRFVVVPDVWLPNSDVLTPTFKLRRRGIAARYVDEIAAMYA